MDLSKLKFARTHEWISPEGKVGISEHAQKEITDVVFVELPPVGKNVQQGTETGTIESVKAAFPIYAPLSGEVIAINENVSKNPALINQAPYEAGWLFQLKVPNTPERNSLMTHEQYQIFLKEEVP